MKRVALVIFTILIVILGAATGLYLWYQDAVFSPTTTPEEAKVVTVEEGQSLLDIAPVLQASGLIKSTEALRIYLRLENPDTDLLVGSYQIPYGLNIPDLLDKFGEGPRKFAVNVTLPEGLRYDEMSIRIESAFIEIPDALFKKEEYDKIAKNPDKYEFSSAVAEFLKNNKPKGKSLEGFLFPDTYNLGADATAKNVIELQITTFIRRLDENGIQTKKYGLKSFYEVLTMASIVEREATSYKDMRMVADIFIRRIKNGWTLGADAPILYPFKDWSYPLTNKELQDASNQYNLRKHLGLTPTPISNPGINAIKAITSPLANDYWYFISTSNGKNYYAKTLSEQNANISKYL